jgi:hypothetical protein
VSFLATTPCFLRKADAMGMTSDPIVVDNALRGQVIKEELRVLNNEEVENYFEIFASGDIGGWTEFYYNGEAVEGMDFAPGSGERVGVEITIPSDAPNGEYSGQLKIKKSPQETDKKEGESTVGVAQQISRDVVITVTDTEIVDLESSISPQSYILNPGDPLQVNAFYYNHGNVSARPDLGLRVIRDNHVLHNSIYIYPEEKEAVPALGQEKIINFYNPGNIEPGKYRVETTVYLNGDKYDEDGFIFEVTGGQEQKNKMPLYAVGFAGIALLTMGGAATFKRFVK